MRYYSKDELVEIAANSDKECETMSSVMQRIVEDAKEGQNCTFSSGKGVIRLTDEQVTILRKRGFIVDELSPERFAVSWY